MHICMHAYIHTYTHTYIHTYIHTYVHTYIHTYIHDGGPFFIYGVWGVEYEYERMGTDGNWGISSSAVKKEKLLSTPAVQKKVLVNKSIQGGKRESRENCYMPLMLLLLLFFLQLLLLFLLLLLLILSFRTVVGTSLCGTGLMLMASGLSIDLSLVQKGVFVW